MCFNIGVIVGFKIRPINALEDIENGIWSKNIFFTCFTYKWFSEANVEEFKQLTLFLRY